MKKKIIEIDWVKFKILMDEETLMAKIKEMAKKIKDDYVGTKPPVLLGVLTGGMYFLSLLSLELGRIGFNHTVSTVKISRYKSNGRTKKITISKLPDFEGENVLVVEDLIDEGISLKCLNEHLRKMKPKSINYCVLVIKKGHEKLGFRVKYKIMSNVNKEYWLVGMGMDDNGNYRYLFFICYKILKSKK